MRTPMVANPASDAAYSCVFFLPQRLAPLQLAMVLVHPPRERNEGRVLERPRPTSMSAPAHFYVPLGIGAGTAARLGPSLVSTADAGGGAGHTINFSVTSRNASSVTLCLVRTEPSASTSSQGGRGSGQRPAPARGTKLLEVALNPTTNKTGDVWHIALPNLKDLDTLVYGWRVDGDTFVAADGKPGKRTDSRFDPLSFLLDPYAPAAVQVELPPGTWDDAPVPPSAAQAAPKWLSPLGPLLRTADWPAESGRPRRPLEDMVAVEVDITKFTTGPAADRAKVKPEHRGTFLGVVDRLPQLVAAGFNTLILSPVMLCAPSASQARHPAPLSLFAPDARFAAGPDPAAAGEQLQQLVALAHAGGMEVILQVELCFTGEPDAFAPSAAPSAGGAGPAPAPSTTSALANTPPVSMRGLDHASYYRRAAPNVLNANHPVVRAMVRDALRHWATAYQVDGFCFLSAENMVLNRWAGGGSGTIVLISLRV